jgi:hypothetical protein
VFSLFGAHLSRDENGAWEANMIFDFFIKLFKIKQLTCLSCIGAWSGK